MENLSNNHEIQQEIVHAITPEEAVELKKEIIPADVISTVNQMISENLRYGYARLLQKDIVKELVDKGMKREDIFAKHWLDFEDMYRDAGWKVEYDSPAYNETYDESFRFEAIKKRIIGSAATHRCVNCSE